MVLKCSEPFLGSAGCKKSPYKFSGGREFLWAAFSAFFGAGSLDMLIKNYVLLLLLVAVQYVPNFNSVQYSTVY